MITSLILTTVLALVICETLSKSQQRERDNSELEFIDYMRRYEPSTVLEKVERLRKRENFTNNEYLEEMFKATDPVPDLLKLKVQNGDARLLVEKDGRRWRPPPRFSSFGKDLFHIRPRLYELMKQAIYSARNKLIIMQDFREKYRPSSLYKMGFLMSRVDNAVKMFSKFALRAYRLCGNARKQVIKDTYLYDLFSVQERMVNLMFNAELLIELLIVNDLNCKEVLRNHTKQRVKNWKFIE